jgi:hypothetical protein
MNKLKSLLLFLLLLVIAVVALPNKVLAGYCGNSYTCCDGTPVYKCGGVMSGANCDPGLANNGGCTTKVCTCNGNASSCTGNGLACSYTYNGGSYSGSCSCSDVGTTCSFAGSSVSNCHTDTRCSQPVDQFACAELDMHSSCLMGDGSVHSIACGWYGSCVWGAWSACSAACGGGITTRTDGCGNTQSAACNTQSCPVTCGNGSCQAGESCGGPYYCPADCGSCPAQCGNGSCQAGENSTNCCNDCGGCAPPPSPPACSPSCSPACGQDNGCGTGTNCANTAGVTPGVPTGLTPANGSVVTPSGGNYTVSWTASSNATSYNVQVYPTGTAAGQECTAPNTHCTTTASTSYLFTLTGNVASYTWRVQAINDVCSAYATAVSAFSSTSTFTIAGTITGQILIDNNNNAVISGSGLCTSAGGATPGAGLASSVIARWGGSNQNSATFSAENYTITNVGYDVNTTVTLTSGDSTYACSCPVGCAYSGLSAPKNAVDFYLTNARNAWWQTSNGLIYSGGAAGNAVLSSIPATCTGGCTPAISLRDATAGVNSSGFVVTGGGDVDTTADTSTNLTYLNQSGTSERVIGMDLHGPKENYAFFSQLFGMGTNPTVNFTGTKPVSGPTNGRAYYAGGDITISAPWTVNEGEKLVIFVNGNLNINSTITVATNGFVAFIVKGNVSVDSTVGTATIAATTPAQVAGVYVADGQIIIETAGAAGDLKFIGEGTFVGWSGVQLQRQFVPSTNNNTAPTELFRFRPDFVTNIPDRMAQPITVWQETN